MGAIDPCHVHPRGDEAAHQLVVGRGFTRERHHDPRHPATRAWAEQCVGIAVERGTTGFETERRRHGEGGRTVQLRAHALHRGKNVRFAAAKRGQTPLAEAALQRPLVTLAQGQVVREIHGVRLVI